MLLALPLFVHVKNMHEKDISMNMKRGLSNQKGWSLQKWSNYLNTFEIHYKSRLGLKTTIIYIWV